MKKLKTLLSRRSKQAQSNPQILDLVQDVLESINEGFALYDPNDHLILWNNEFIKTFPAIKDLVYNSPSFTEIEEILLTSGQLQVNKSNQKRWLQMRTKQRSLPSSQTEYQLIDGRWIRMIDRRTSHGNMVSVCHDITESKTREEKLRAAKEMAEAASRTKSTFLAHVSHELRTPLNAIIGFSEMMSRGLLGPIGNEQYQAYTEDIHQSAQHLLGLIDDILNVSKAEVGHLELNEKTFSIAEVAMQIERMIAQRIQEAALTFQLEISPQLPLLHADERKIKQILINLLVNSIKFTPKGGNVSLTIQQDSKEGLELIVEDTGIGMDKNDIPRALEAFGQVENTMSRRYEGSGLGLYLTSTYVKIHGGRLQVRSKKGSGTKVIVHIPLERTVKAAA